MSEAMHTALDQRSQKTIAGLTFSDLYLEPNGAWFKASPRDRERRALSSHLADEALELRKELQQQKGALAFRAHWSGIDLRINRLVTLEGDVYICRRLHDPIAFADIGYPERLRKAMLTDAFSRGGLVLFTGATGDGKSMSLASWLIERLKVFGGTACTIENPIEMILQRQYHGEKNVTGTCYQSEVRSDDEFGPMIIHLMRAAPTMIMLGEIRESKAAREAVLAGTSGHLVGSTLHANDLPTALERMKNMTREAGLDASFLADSLCAVFHQNMSVNRFGDEERRTVNVSPLIISGATNEEMIRANLREGDFSLLASEMQRQRRIADSTGEAMRF
ncbi:ATPase, T2SS/T4P/T4SS family [Paraburkholderia sp. BR10872]|uniref:ATPase, T2SS/T4P/T4SS family n=1 Tax=Paraburkholderia sp. BR10872 TaxID=3236989 RepID=UPI0034D267C6